MASSQNVTAELRSTALLECLVQGYSGQVEWRKSGQGNHRNLDFGNLIFFLMIAKKYKHLSTNKLLSSLQERYRLLYVNKSS